MTIISNEVVNFLLLLKLQNNYLSTKIKIRNHYLKHQPAWLLCLSFLIPVFALLIYYIFFQQVYPFGNSSILTIDLGQQYIDFYAYFNETFRHRPEQFFYSFQKGLGGEMWGTWSYYLLSPFMYLTLLFPASNLSVACWLMVLLKVGLASFNFSYLLYRHYQDITIKTLSLALAYGLMGYFQANQLNIMWLDGPMILPLIILGLEQLLANQKPYLYIFSLSYALITNYYIGYMICLFSSLYYIYACFKTKSNIKTYLNQAWRFAYSSLLSAGLSAFVLIPTIFSLMQSKTSTGFPNYSWALRYPPYKVLSKLFIGAFDFDQMPHGLPNIYIGSLALILVFLYFCSQHIHWREKILAAFIIIIFFLSFIYEPLQLLWHGGQFPIWYPERYSFTFSFFLLWLAYQSFRHLPQSSKTFYLGLACCWLALSLYVYYKIEDFSFLSIKTIIISSLAFTIFLFLFAYRKQIGAYFLPSLFLLTCLELTASTYLSLSAISYLDQAEFSNFPTYVTPVINKIKPGPNNFYRINKSFQRTRNDAMQGHYYDLNHFNSTLEKNTIDFYQSLGLATTSGSIQYQSGTPLTDALFAIRYRLELDEVNPLSDSWDFKKRSYRENFGKKVALEASAFKLYEKQHPTQFGMLLPKDFAKLKIDNNNPISLQEKIFMSATGNKQVALFTNVPFKAFSLNNATSHNPAYIQTEYTVKNKKEDAYIDLTLPYATDDSYYLYIPGHFDDEAVTFYLDGEKIAYENNRHLPELIEVGSNKAGLEGILTVKFEGSIDLRGLYLYRFNNSAINEWTEKLAKQHFALTKFLDNHIEANFESENGQMIVLSLPYNEDWHINIDGKPAIAQPILNGGLTGVKVQAGEHHLQMTFKPKGFISGYLISSLAILILIIQAYNPKLSLLLPKRKKAA